MNSTSTTSPLPSSNTASVAANAATRRYAKFGSFHLDLEGQELFKDGQRIRVQGKVCEALMILVANSGEVVTRETLRTRLWPNETQINYDANVNTTVNKLRQILGDTADRPAFVETIPRKGYTFVANVESVALLPLVEPSAADNASPQTSKNNSLKNWRELFGGASASRWFTAGVISLLIAAILFGAAVTLFAHRGF